MSICGFGFGKNLIQLDYPVVESVRSILPLCDRFVYVIGESEDGTRDLVASIDPKVEIVDSTWPEVKVDGTVLSIEANKALAAATATGCDWGFYIQADEVVHEDDLEGIRTAAQRWKDDQQVKALLFRYLHFVLDYQTTDPWMYHKASRVIRLDESCEIVADACGPALKEWDGPRPYLDKHHLGRAVRWSGGRIFHYGWVKTDTQLEDKMQMVEDLWWGTLDEKEMERRKDNKFGRFVERYPILKQFRGSHPAVMAERVAAHRPHRPRRNRWLNPRFHLEVLKHGFHG